MNTDTSNGQSKAIVTTNDQPRELAQFGELSVKGIVARKEKILEIMRSVMRDGQHYGVIPGCGDKPTLYKAGAEILATTFALAPKFKITRTDMQGGHREYEIVCTMVHIPSGLELGEGVGTCSTMESKYRWRGGGRKCPDCSKVGTVIKGKAEYGGGWLCFGRKGGCGSKWKEGDQLIEGQSADRVENPDIADQYNTVLKMAKKRAQVDATLTATGASDLLTQDLEDIRGVADDFRGDVEDADFRDVPRGDYGPSYGGEVEGNDVPSGDGRGHMRSGNGNNGNGQRRSNGPDLQTIATELIADIRQCETVVAVRATSPRFKALPKGTRERSAANAAYDEQIAKLGGQKGAA